MPNIKQAQASARSAASQARDNNSADSSHGEPDTGLIERPEAQAHHVEAHDEILILKKLEDALETLRHQPIEVTTLSLDASVCRAMSAMAKDKAQIVGENAVLEERCTRLEEVRR
jgi:hypothetical protein